MDYCIKVTWDCNWFCDYCIVDTHDDKNKITHDEVLNKLKLVNSDDTVTISGGEPGLVSSEYMQEYFDILMRRGVEISVDTNGMFFKKHSNLVKYTEEIYYHCSDNLDDELITYDSMKDTNVFYLLVLTDKNIVNLNKYMEKYKDVLFSLIKADRSIMNNKETLSFKNALKIYSKYKNRIEPESARFLLESCSEIDPRLKVI